MSRAEPHPRKTRSAFVNWTSSYWTTWDYVALPQGSRKYEPAARADLHAGGLESAAGRLLVLDHEPEMAGAVRTARAALDEREELITDVDERSAARATSQG